MWIQEAKSLPLQAAAKMLNLEIKKSNSISPCPCCGAIYRGSEDKRGPVGMNKAQSAWQCHGCGKRGDVVDLVSYCMFEMKLKDMNMEQKAKVRDWFQDKSSKKNYTPRPTEPQPPKRPDLNQVLDLWKASDPLIDMNGCREDQMVRDFLKLRNFDLELLNSTGIVRVTPLPHQYRWPRWWPSKWSPTWRLICPAFESNGKVASLHARAIIDKEVRPKSRWPMGCEANGLVLANKQGVSMLRGKPSPDLEALLICEGITDLFRAATAAIHENMNIAILSGTSGSFSKIHEMSIPENLDIVICTDPDEAGEAYAQLLKKKLKGKKVYRMKLEK